MREGDALKAGHKPLVRIVGHATHAHEPALFTTAPVGAMQKLAKNIGWNLKDVDLFEINEAFAVVNAICINEAGIPWERTNVHGGAISLGHPTGYTGARLTLHLANILKPGELGLAAACGGGGLTGSLIIKGE